jgi:phenylacetic acid degradation operon negative regulatory protein
MRTEFELALEFFFWGLEVFSCRDCGLILAGYRVTQGERRIDQLLDRLKREKLLAQSGRGSSAQFTITDRGRQRVRVPSPAQHWNRPWDRQWRAFLFDIPSNRRKDRIVLWRALRDARFGLLQRSVWVWPHEVETTLREVVEARGIPECFCGFEVSRLLFCDNAQVVETAWDFEAIGKAHAGYCNHPVANQSALNRARDAGELARVARAERDAYHYAFALDPLLPQALWPKDYQGARLQECHQTFMARLRTRLRELTAS